MPLPRQRVAPASGSSSPSRSSNCMVGASRLSRRLARCNLSDGTPYARRASQERSVTTSARWKLILLYRSAFAAPSMTQQLDLRVDQKVSDRAYWVRSTSESCRTWNRADHARRLPVIRISVWSTATASAANQDGCEPPQPPPSILGSYHVPRT